MDFGQLVKQFLALPLPMQIGGGVFALIIFVAIVKIVFKGKKNHSNQNFDFEDPNVANFPGMGGQPTFDFEDPNVANFPGMGGQMGGFNQLPQGYLQQPQQALPAGQQYDPMTGQPLAQEPEVDNTHWLGLLVITFGVAVIITLLASTGLNIPVFGINTIKTGVNLIAPLFKNLSVTYCLAIFFLFINVVSFGSLANESVSRGKHPFKIGADRILNLSLFAGLLIVIGLGSGTFYTFLKSMSMKVPEQALSIAAIVANTASSLDKNPLTGFVLVAMMAFVPGVLFSTWKAYGMYLLRYAVVLFFATVTANQVFPVATLTKNPFGGIFVLFDILGKYGLKVDPKLAINYTGFFVTVLLLIAVYELLENTLFDSFVYSVKTKKFNAWDFLFLLFLVPVFITPKVWYGAQLIFRTVKPEFVHILAGSFLFVLIKFLDNIMLSFDNNEEINSRLVNAFSDSSRFVFMTVAGLFNFIPMVQQWIIESDKKIKLYKQERQQKRAQQDNGRGNPPSNPNAVALWDPNDPNNRR